jgi:hypothetical protein
MDGNGELTGAGEVGNNGARAGRVTKLRPWAIAVSFAVGIHAYAASLWLSINLLDIPMEEHVVGADIAALIVPAIFLFIVSMRAELEERTVRRCFLLLCAALPAVTIPFDLLVQVILFPWLDRTPDIFMHIGLVMAIYIIVFCAGWATYRAVTIACGRPHLGESSGQ